MARISPKNPRFREKEELVRDASQVLKSNFHYGTKYAVLHEVTWVWTEFDGKYAGCPYWSEKALEIYKDRKSIPGFACDKWFRHDHAVPRKIVLGHVLSPDVRNDEDYLRDIFEKALVGVILTKEEDGTVLKDSMPLSLANKSLEDFTAIDKWARYKAENIKVFRVGWQGYRKKIISKQEVSR